MKQNSDEVEIVGNAFMHSETERINPSPTTPHQSLCDSCLAVAQAQIGSNSPQDCYSLPICRCATSRGSLIYKDCAKKKYAIKRNNITPLADFVEW